MDNLKLNDAILLSVEKPARYVGHEYNAVYKNKENIDVRMAFCFPDVYEIGMSYLGLQILYHLFNKREDTWCERVFAPWVDLEKILVEKSIPLFALESQDPIRVFDFLTFTLQYEMSYTNILNIMKLSEIPMLSSERSEDMPIICAGGPCAYNPEPLADFVDFFYLGEGETLWPQLIDVYKKMKQEGKSKKDYLEAIATFDGIYVPSFYDVDYHEDGTLKSFTKNNPHAKDKIKKQVVSQLTESIYPENPIVPFIQTVHDRVVIELFRGCIRGCRFCQAGMIYRPVREKHVNALKQQALDLIKATGHDEISLISLSSSDYDDLFELSEFIMDTVGKEQHVNLSLPSLRIDKFSLDLMQKVQDVRKSSLTFAPEAGSQRMRDVINKGITTEDILNGSSEAFKGGWNRVKLYFMLGLPTEKDEDILEIASLSQEIVEKYYELPKELRRTKVQIIVSTSFFVPKPFTPFQWYPQNTSDQFLLKQNLLNRAINKKNIRYNSHDADTSVMEGAIARGDRKLGKVLMEAVNLGAHFDGWSEHFNMEIWEKAFETVGIDPDFYCTRERCKDELFPWDFIDVGVTKSFLYKEYEKAIAEKTTPNCKESCTGCGATVFDGGICNESKN